MPATFQTNQLKSRRKAIIDGHEYTVRRLGNIERLEINQRTTEIRRILGKYPKDVSDNDIKQADIDTLERLALESAKTMVSLFDDGTETQEKARELVRSLDEEDLLDIIEATFAQTEAKNGDTKS